MGYSRRKFVRTAPCLLIGAGLGARLHGQDLPQRGSRLASRQDFEPLLNEVFEAAGKSGERIWMRLVSVADLPDVSVADVNAMAVRPYTRSAPSKPSGFMLRFHAAGESLQQDTYQVSHAKTGRFPLFLVPSQEGWATATICRISTSPDWQPPVRQKKPASAPAKA